MYWGLFGFFPTSFSSCFQGHLEFIYLGRYSPSPVPTQQAQHPPGRCEYPSAAPCSLPATRERQDIPALRKCPKSHRFFFIYGTLPVRPSCPTARPVAPLPLTAAPDGWPRPATLTTRAPLYLTAAGHCREAAGHGREGRAGLPGAAGRSVRPSRPERPPQEKRRRTHPHCHEPGARERVRPGRWKPSGPTDSPRDETTKTDLPTALLSSRKRSAFIRPPAALPEAEGLGRRFPSGHY